MKNAPTAANVVRLEAIRALILEHGTNEILNTIADACDALADLTENKRAAAAYSRAGDALRTADSQLGLASATTGDQDEPVLSALEVLAEVEA